MNIKKISFILLISCGFSNTLFPKYSIADSLPDNMPMIKSFLWGQNGFLRGKFIDPKSRLKELEMRKNMLQMHQKFALFTMGCMLYQYNSGKSMEDNSFSDYSDVERIKHMNLGYLTFGTYMTAAGLSILSPPGMKYTKNNFSNMKIHRYLAIIHFTGMALQPYLGYQASVAGLENRGTDRQNILKYHDIIGGITTASYIVSFLTTLF